MSIRVILYTILILSATGIISAIILYFTAKKFQVEENPLVQKIFAVLPGINCGGCGHPGCQAFAEACAKTTDLSILFCPVGGNTVMKKVAEALGIKPAEKEPIIAVVRCNGAIKNRHQTNIYDSAQTCSIVHALYGGETGCEHGCLSLGDCVISCHFDAMEIDHKSGLPIVKENKCIACGACIKACPRKIIQLRKKGPDGKRVFVSCINTDKGGVAIKNCKVACIACGKCVKECPVEAITITNNLAYIDFNKCTLCRKCVTVCPTKAIYEVNFPAKAKEVNA